MSAPVSLPKLGATLAGGKFAGILTNAGGQHYALVLLPDMPGNSVNWQDAMTWAKALDAHLPTRPEAALLFETLKAEFEPSWHWLSDESGSSWAWFQGFSYGTQSSYRKSHELRARAVRRLLFTHSVISEGVEIAPLEHYEVLA